MDKCFFKFDIDDEVLKAESQKEDACQKSQIETKIDEIPLKNSELLIAKRTSNGRNKTDKGYEIGVGLKTQREINPNLCMVEDYINFDFRAKNKMLANVESGMLDSEKEFEALCTLMAEDKSVEEVVNRAHIGVIFY